MMRVKIQASTGSEVVVWRDGTLFYAARAGAEKEAQVCLGVDLFEVIAELAALDLEQSDEAREAIELADAVQTDLARV
jgi:hypothetical protein